MSTGGTAGSGNQAGMGAGGSGGSGSPTCGASFAVTGGGYVTAPGSSGCWRGYAYTATSAGSMIMPANYQSCGDPCMLCAGGSVAPSVDFSGLGLVGFNLNQAVDQTGSATVTPTGTNLVVNFSNVTSAPLRVQIIGLNGDTVATERWCAMLPATTVGPVSIPYTSFNTQCWAGGMGTAYAKQPIKGVQLLVPGGNQASTPFAVCLTSVTDS